MSVPSDKALSKNARLAIDEIRSGGCETKNDILRKLNWSRPKLRRVEQELAGHGFVLKSVVHVTRGKVKSQKAEKKKAPPGVQELVRYFVGRRYPDQKVSQDQWGMFTGQAARALATYDLQTMKNCIDWLSGQPWWKDKGGWTIAAVAKTGMLQYQKYRSKQQRMPGADESLTALNDDR